MIELRHDNPSGRYHIRGYRDNQVLINETRYARSLVVCSHTLIDNWRPTSLEDLRPSDWEQIIALKPKVVLIGTGATLQFPATELLAPLINHKIGFELMDTAAACRTFTVLLAEDREVVAALLLP